MILTPYLYAGKGIRQIYILRNSLGIIFYLVWAVGQISILKGYGSVRSNRKAGSFPLDFSRIYGSAIFLSGHQNGIPIGIAHPGHGDRIQDTEHQYHNS